MNLAGPKAQLLFGKMYEEFATSQALDGTSTERACLPVHELDLDMPG